MGHTATWFCPLHEDCVLKKRTDAPDGSDGGALVRLDHGTFPGTHAANLEHRRSKWTALVLATGSDCRQSMRTASRQGCPLSIAELGE